MKNYFQSHNGKPVYAVDNLLLGLAFLLVLLPTWVSAQITGRVVDIEGNGLEGVNISALHNGANAISSADGRFLLELEVPVGIGQNELLGKNVTEVQGTQLQMNLQSGQIEVHAQSGVFDLQGRVLRIAEDTRGYRYGLESALRKALAQADTLVFVKDDYVSTRVEIREDAVDLGDVMLANLCADIVLDANQMCDSRDGQVYATTTIGTQIWMAENLNYESTSGSYCYNDSTNYCNTYGRLYTWGAAMDSASSSSTSPSGVRVCPDGWHLPSDDEWETLAEYVATETGLTSKSGDVWTQIGSKLKSTTGWNSSGNGSDDFGFSGLPGGFWDIDGSYFIVGYDGYWWSSTGSSSSSAYGRYLVYNNDNFYRDNYSKSNAYSVRCLQGDGEALTYNLTFDSDGGSAMDALQLAAGASITSPVNPTKTGYTFAGWSPALPATMPSEDLTVTAQWEITDTFIDSRDGKEYRTTTIGTQTWMAENLAYLPSVNEKSDSSTTEAKFYVYGYDGTDVVAAKASTNFSTYGALYNWPAIMAGAEASAAIPSGVQGICPTGWHVPSHAEWLVLTDHVATAGELKANSSLWSTYNGTDDYGFSVLPGGAHFGTTFYDVGDAGYWWSATTAVTPGRANYRYINTNADVKKGNWQNVDGFSLRCVQD